MMLSRFLSIALLLGISLPAAISAQGIPLGGAQSAGHVKWQLRLEPAKAAPGDTVRVIARYELTKGWHLYAPDFEGTGLATKLTLDGASVLKTSGDPKFPDPIIKKIVVLDEETHRLLEGAGEIEQSFVVSSEAEPAKLNFRALLTYMTCDENTCDPPSIKQPHALKLEVVARQDTATGAPSLIPLPKPGAGKAPGLLGADLLGAGRVSPGPHIQWTVRVEPERVKPGDRARIIAEYDLDDGYYIYAPTSKSGVPTELKTDSASVAVNGAAQYPIPKIKTIAGETFPTLPTDGVIRQAVDIAPGTAAGKLDFNVLVSFMTCTTGLCDPPSELKFPISLTVEPGAVGTAEANPAEPSPPEAEPTEARPPEAGPPESGSATTDASVESVGLWELILLMIGGGLFALVMPCTYPMIPITISFFTKQAEAKGGQPVLLAIVYGLGIILSFNLIGVVVHVGLLGQGTILDIAAGGWLNLIFGLLFFYFALVLMGVFNIRLPASLNKLTSKAMGLGGFLGVLALGATLVVTSFTCTAPIMGTLLVVASKGDSLGRVCLGMSAFGGTLALPFVLLSLFPSRVQAMPRSGEWMNTVKIFLGLVEIGAGMKFISNADLAWGWAVLPRETFLISWTAILGVAALYLLGTFRFKQAEHPNVGGVRVVMGIVTAFFALYFYLGAQGTSLDATTESLVPPYSLHQERGLQNGGKVGDVDASEAGAPGRHLAIVESLEEGLRVAKESGKLIFVEFTGPT